jgi:uracil phosphoribosyltransferase
MFVLNQQASVAHHFLAELRDVHIQQDAMRFRKNMERLGVLLAYEISKTLDYQPRAVQTPLAQTDIPQLIQQPLLACILRASLPFHQGFLSVFDQAPHAFIGAYRGKHQPGETFDIQMDYVASPRLDGQTLLLIDPMLATGKSLLKSYEALLAYGQPRRVLVASVIAAPKGLAFLQEAMPQAEFFLAAIDERLNDQFYIVPGLGDAGDLAFGVKM